MRKIISALTLLLCLSLFADYVENVDQFFVKEIKKPDDANVTIYGSKTGPVYWYCGGSEITQNNVEAKVYKDGELVTQDEFEPYRIYHGAFGCELKFWIKQAGNYTVVVDDYKDNKHYMGTYNFTINHEWETFSSDAGALQIEVNDNKLKRTVIFIYGQTQVGQDMFIRGGLDHGFANNTLGKECSTDNFNCSISIHHNRKINDYTSAWKSGDKNLDWYGIEDGQGFGAEGTALEWTTNNSYHGATVISDGFGYTPLNDWGDHYWMLDVNMDCSQAYKDSDGNKWFEIKSYISNGPGWESDVNQTDRPYVSGNHFAKCGMINVFQRSSGNVTYIDLP